VRRTDPVAAAGATALASLGLLALAGARGWLGDDVGAGSQFCEVAAHQPVNSLSNLGFVVAGLAIAARARHSRLGGIATVFACLVVLLGPTSMAMHATGTAAGGQLDVLSMYLVAAFAVAYAAARRLHKGPAFTAGVFAGVVAVCELATTYDAHVPVVNAAGNAAFGLFLLLAIALEATDHGGLDKRWLVGAVASLAGAFAIWNTARTGSGLCFPHSLYQGHAVWHLLCAVGAWCLFRLWDSSPSSPSGSDLPSRADAVPV
jgi:hypothetical protein